MKKSINLTSTGFITQVQQSGTPAVPAAGEIALYPKIDGNYYRLNSSGIETNMASATVAGQLPGTTTNDSASAGNVGELVEVIYGNTGTGNNQGLNFAGVVSITLTAGEWDIYGAAVYAGGSTISDVVCMVSNLSAAAAYARFTGGTFSDSLLNHEASVASFAAGFYGVANVGPQGVKIPNGSTVTYTTYVMCGGGSGGNTSIYGSIKARRVR